MKTIGKEFKLCYVEGNFAYFTNKELSEQWGDDWDDAPYEHNAELPYEREDTEIIKVAFDGGLDTPCEGHVNSPFSVKAINSGAIAWLRSEPWVEPKIAIQAGAGFKEFAEKIKSIDGEVYLPLENK